MCQFSNRIAFVVPTRDRPQELCRLLTSIKVRGYWPDQTIIVNGGDAGLETTLTEFSNLPIQHIEVQPPSLTKQKNAGVKMVDPSINLIACIDDDIVLEDGALEAMLKFWETAGEDAGGASFNILGERPATSFIQRVFFIDNREFGLVLPSGYNTPITNSQKTQVSQWLVGGATVWRREVFRKYSFNEWFLGSGAAEDLDFSYRVGKEYKLYVVADAHVQHLEPKGSWKSNFRTGKVQVINRTYFVRNNPNLSRMKCFWTLFGRLLENLAMGILRADLRRLLRAFGNVVGLVQVITGKLPRVEVSQETKRSSAR